MESRVGVHMFASPTSWAPGRRGSVPTGTIMPTPNSTSTLRNHAAWNKGRLLGQKRPLRPKDVWTIRVRLQLDGRKRDLAMFNLSIDSKLRGCDLVRLQVNDVCVGGRVRDRAVVIQKKTGRPVQFELTEQTRRAVQDWLDRRGAVTAEYLFPSRFATRPHVSTRQYARIVQKWVTSAGTRWFRLRNALHATDQSGSDIQKDGKFARRPTFTGAHQVGKHGPLSRHRGRRRSQHFRTGRPLKGTRSRPDANVFGRDSYPFMTQSQFEHGRSRLKLSFKIAAACLIYGIALHNGIRH